MQAEFDVYGLYHHGIGTCFAIECDKESSKYIHIHFIAISNQKIVIVINNITLLSVENSDVYYIIFMIG